MDEELRRDLYGLKFFADAMKEKLDKKRKEGRGGWHDPNQCSIDELRNMLIDHFEEGNGDMVDIANFAMMIWNREQ